METQEKSAIDRLFGFFDKAAAELEELRLQLALGKAEARDKFEELKASFSKTIHEAKVKALPWKAKLEALQVQLALGKAETRDAFMEQKKKILAAIHELETMLHEAGLAGDKDAAALRAELEVVKIKLKIIEDKIEGRMGGEKKNELDELKQELKDKFASIKKKMQERKTGVAEHWGHFTDEIGEAFEQMKKVFSK